MRRLLSTILVSVIVPFIGCENHQAILVQTCSEKIPNAQKELAHYIEKLDLISKEPRVPIYNLPSEQNLPIVRGIASEAAPSEVVDQFVDWIPSDVEVAAPGTRGEKWLMGRMSTPMTPREIDDWKNWVFTQTQVRIVEDEFLANRTPSSEVFKNQRQLIKALSNEWVVLYGYTEWGDIKNMKISLSKIAQIESNLKSAVCDMK
jgi:hypothetical protein